MHARLSRTRLLGFTLLELIVTIVVLGVLAALAVPAFSAVVDRSKDETLKAEMEALGRGISALAAFDGELTDATVAEFVEAEASAGTELAASDRWTVFTGAPAGEPAPGELYVADEGGFVGAAAVVPHDEGRVAYLLVGSSGGHAELPDGTAVSGADALCFYGIDAGSNTGCTDDSEGGASSVGGPVSAGPEASSYTVTVATDGQGSVIRDPDGDTVAGGTRVTLTAQPAAGWSFQSWTGDLDSSTNPAEVTVDRDIAVTAVFIEDTPNFAIAGPSGRVVTSVDAVDWALRFSDSGAHLHDAVYGGGTWVAVGGYGGVVRSTDGIVWTAVDPGTTAFIDAVGYGNGLFVATGRDGLVLSSPDGVAWTQRASGVIEPLYGVAHDGSQWVAVGWAGTLITSTDGMSWTVRSSGTTEALYSVAHGGGSWVAVGNNGTVLTSTSGTSWVSRSTPAVKRLTDVSHHTGTWVTVGAYDTTKAQPELLTSSDGVNWTARSVPATSNEMLNGVGYANGTWVASTQSSSTVWASTDGGASWSNRSVGSVGTLRGVATR